MASSEAGRRGIAAEVLHLDELGVLEAPEKLVDDLPLRLEIEPGGADVNRYDGQQLLASTPERDSASIPPSRRGLTRCPRWTCSFGRCENNGIFSVASSEYTDSGCDRPKSTIDERCLSTFRLARHTRHWNWRSSRRSLRCARSRALELTASAAGAGIDELSVRLRLPDAAAFSRARVLSQRPSHLSRGVFSPRTGDGLHRDAGSRAGRA